LPYLFLLNEMNQTIRQYCFVITTYGLLLLTILTFTGTLLAIIDFELLLLRDAMRKRGLCCRPVSVWSSHTGIVCKRLNLSQNL